MPRLSAVGIPRLQAGEDVNLYAKAKTDNLTGPKLKEIKHALEK